ncbi:MAG: hypothetical protein EOL87_16385 [Spartobacteria bacterium]|nr:hypothetical protein [Spartobacteria bacterium]
MKDDYRLLDCGDGKKLEQFGPFKLSRPAGQAVWSPSCPSLWKDADAGFDRKGGLNWRDRTKLAEDWSIRIEGITFRLSTTDFGHIGVFPEQAAMWKRITELCTDGRQREPEMQVLNLFAYSGGSTMAVARSGVGVCHLDASHGMVEWARKNAALNGLENAPIRWIVDDVRRFIQREIRRERRYHAVILDPPSFGRGKNGEVFKIQQDLLPLLYDLKKLAPRPEFIALSCHTPEFTGLCLKNLLNEVWKGCTDIEHGEMVIPSDGPALPSGSYALLKGK